MLSIFSLFFLTGVGVYVGVRVCRTRTYTLHVGYSDVSPGVKMRHLENQKNPDRLKRCINVDRMFVQSTSTLIYAGPRDDDLG